MQGFAVSEILCAEDSVECFEKMNVISFFHMYFQHLETNRFNALSVNTFII